MTLSKKMKITNWTKKNNKINYLRSFNKPKKEQILIDIKMKCKCVIKNKMKIRKQNQKKNKDKIINNN